MRIKNREKINGLYDDLIALGDIKFYMGDLYLNHHVSKEGGVKLNKHYKTLNKMMKKIRVEIIRLESEKE